MHYNIKAYKLYEAGERESRFTVILTQTEISVIYSIGNWTKLLLSLCAGRINQHMEVQTHMCIYVSSLVYIFMYIHICVCVWLCGRKGEQRNDNDERQTTITTTYAKATTTSIGKDKDENSQTAAGRKGCQQRPRIHTHTQTQRSRYPWAGSILARTYLNVTDCLECREDKHKSKAQYYYHYEFHLHFAWFIVDVLIA